LTLVCKKYQQGLLSQCASFYSYDDEFPDFAALSKNINGWPNTLAHLGLNAVHKPKNLNTWFKILNANGPGLSLLDVQYSEEPTQLYQAIEQSCTGLRSVLQMERP